MPPRANEGLNQKQILLALRYAIDTAITYPTRPNIERAVEVANAYPQALRSTQLRLNLGSRRWAWLDQHGITAIGEAHEIAGAAAVKGTASPDITT